MLPAVARRWLAAVVFMLVPGAATIATLRAVTSGPWIASQDWIAPLRVAGGILLGVGLIVAGRIVLSLADAEQPKHVLARRRKLLP